MCYAVICGRFDVIMILLNNPDVDRDKKNLQSLTPLMLAAERGNLDAVTALLCKGKSKDCGGFASLECF
jgi:ankyrin repeat protein